MALSRKRCNICRELKPLGEFHRCATAPDGRQYRCKFCNTELQRDRARALGIREKHRRDPALLSRGLKLCLLCDEAKKLVHFSPTLRGWGGVAAYCKPCMSRYQSSRPQHRRDVYVWRSKNRARWLSQHAAHQQRRRACVADGTVTPGAVAKLYRRQRCFYCGKRVARKRRTVDHKVPLVRGGSHSISNLVMACGPCNFRKSARTAEEFMSLLEVA